MCLIHCNKANRQPERQTTEPIDRSMPEVMITNATPIPRIPNNAVLLNKFSMLLLSKNEPGTVSDMNNQSDSNNAAIPNTLALPCNCRLQNVRTDDNNVVVFGDFGFI